MSLALVKPYGMAGVLLGTLLSYLLQILYRYIIYFLGFPRDAGRGAAVCAGYREYLAVIAGEVLLMQKNRTTDIRSRRYASVLRLLSPVYCDSAAAGSGDLWKRLETSEHCNHGEGKRKPEQ